MKTYAPADIRNFAIVGHASAGKTMLTEAMLRCSGKTQRLGRIAAGTTASDYHFSEKQRQISTQASILHLEWQDRKFNLIDTPGYLDFISESLGALRVGDFALVVVHAVHGLGVGTDRVWNYANGYGLPKVIVVNALDRENTDFAGVLRQLQERFGRHVFPLNLPINPGPGFNQVLDVLRNEVVTYATDDSGKYQEVPATGEWAARVKELHRELIEHIAESDDGLLDRYFAQGGLAEEEFRAGIHAAVQKELFIPVFCTSAETNVGVARLMDFIAKYGSSPVDRRKVQARDPDGEAVEVALEDPEPTVYVFKTMAEEHFGELSFLRVYSGNVAAGDELFNSARKTTERVGQLFFINGHERTLTDVLGPGDIGATVKLKDTHTGNTLSSPERPVALPGVVYPKPNIHSALTLSVKGEEEKIATGLAALHHEDPTFLFQVDPELHQTVLSAQGELHLEVLADRLRRRFGVHVELSEPRVPFRETIRLPADSKYRHKKQTGGAGQFAEVWMKISPRTRDTGVEFTQSLTGQNVDRGFVPAVEKGVQTACAEGILAGYRVVDVAIDFYDGKMHPVDSKDIAFRVAGYFAFKEAFLAAHPCLLEPLHRIEIRAPEDCLGKVMGDLSSRRGRIQGVDSDGVFQIIRAEAPAAELHHYSSVLRALTGGRGVHTEELSHYEEMPRELEQKIVADAQKRRANHDKGHSE